MNRQGLTLIEILIALVIIVVAFSALAYSQITNLRVTRESKLASIATQVANATMERSVKLLLEQGVLEYPESLDDPPIFRPTFRCPDGSTSCTDNFEDVSVEGTDYRGDYQIEIDAATGLATVTVTIQDPAPVTMMQLVSCMDVVPAPSFGDPRPCPESSP